MSQNDSRADQIIRDQERMAGDRSMWESHWKECAERIRPALQDFQGSRSEPGDKRTDKMFDSTAPLALERFTAAVEAMATPRTQTWHKVGNKRLQGSKESQAWFDAVTQKLFRSRYSPRANFSSQNTELIMSLGLFGTGAMFIDELVGTGLRYRALHLAEVYIAEDHAGRIDQVHRRFEYTARQAVQKWGDKCPEKIREAAEKTPERTFEFIHCVKPNAERLPSRRDYRGMAFSSYYVSIEGKTILDEGGYRTMPYAISRYVTAPREIYGRSPAMTALADIKMLNEMEKTILRSAHRVVDPPLLLTEDGVLGAMNTRPGALNYGGVDANGRQTVVPLQTGANIPLGLEMSDQRRRSINSAFLVDLFQILVEAPQMTATEALIRAQEKGALLAPTLGRLQSEYLGTMIEREIDILSAAGQLPPMPDELLELGGEYEIEYVSPLNLAQRAEEGVAIMRTLEAVMPLAQLDPSVLKVFNAEEIARELAAINGTPAKILRSKEEVEAMEDAEASRQQATDLLAAAPVVAESAKNLAQAGAVAGSSPNNLAAMLGGAA